MSGGHFNYVQFQIEDIAADVDELSKISHYPPDIFWKFIEARDTLALAAEMVHQIDWLVSGDYGPDSFQKEWDKEVKPLEAKVYRGAIALGTAQKAVWAVWEKAWKVAQKSDGSHYTFALDIKQEAVKQVDYLESIAKSGGK